MRGPAPIVVRAAFKPTSSVAALGVKGRHDPCVGIRATPIAEAMLAFVLADQNTNADDLLDLLVIPPDFAAIQPRALNRNAALDRPGVLALSSSTYAYDDDGKKQHDFHGEKLHQGRGGRNG